MHQEMYSLKWHTYSDHLRSMMKELMMNEDFSDVTLVTEDKKQIQANTSRPTSESSSKELYLGCKLNQTWTRPDLDLT